jgi:hypothetical protein
VPPIFWLHADMHRTGTLKRAALIGLSSSLALSAFHRSWITDRHTDRDPLHLEFSRSKLSNKVYEDPGLV